MGCNGAMVAAPPRFLLARVNQNGPVALAAPHSELESRLLACYWFGAADQSHGGPHCEAKNRKSLTRGAVPLPLSLQVVCRPN